MLKQFQISWKTTFLDSCFKDNNVSMQNSKYSGFVSISIVNYVNSNKDKHRCTIFRFITL